MVNFVKTYAEFQELIKSSQLVVVDFTASWCGPCRMIAPVIDQMAVENPNVIFVKVDVDDAQEISEKCKIQAMPTFQFYKDGNMLQEFRGANQAQLKECVAKYA